MCNNQRYLVFSKNLKHHSKTIYINIQNYFRRKKIEDNILDMKYYAIKEILVNVSTKTLIKDRHRKLIKTLRFNY